METSGKVWGETVLIFNKPGFELHRIKVLAGGYCSKHLHEQKHNAFYVEDGVLVVSVWKKDYPLEDITVLTKGQLLVVSPGEMHQFSSPAGCTALEVYYAELRTNDIKRESCGGRHTPQDSPTDSAPSV